MMISLTALSTNLICEVSASESLCQHNHDEFRARHGRTCCASQMHVDLLLRVLVERLEAVTEVFASCLYIPWATAVVWEEVDDV